MLKRLKAIDYFAGAGGMSLGAEQAGFDVVGAIEYDPVHAEIHKLNFPYASAPLVEDIATLTPAKVMDEIEIGSGELDLVFGGPPCQGFSFIGYRDHADTRNDLVMTFARHVDALRPRAFVMENVPGILAGDMRPVLDAAIGYLRQWYAVPEPQILNAADFGVPQIRRRVFVLGLRRDLDAMPSYPVPTHTVRVTVRDAIADLPDISKLAHNADHVRYDRQPETDYAKIARGVIFDTTDQSQARVWDRSICTNCRPTQHTEESIRRFDQTKPGDVEKVSRFLRLDWSGQANTLRAGTGTDRGSYTAPRPIHPELPRVITVREAARLHGFPDWFRFHPTKFHGFRQVGNAVAPPVMRAVANELRVALARDPRPVELAV